ncbi:hypothetical protein OGZ51_07250 [Lactococcus lactis]|uniref:Uncharacterized protein n=1 Tax=Lactococcus lactis TaxID=1358 RepID=A0A9X4NIB1_9LACT|nr:hypothetical protein [Lactococcus lactis]MDG4983937.1 hypothetical protein [Lactococcus lactis]
MSKKIILFIGVIALGIGITVFTGHSHSKKTTATKSVVSTSLSSSSKQSDDSRALDVVNQFIKAYYNYSNSDEQKKQSLPLCTDKAVKALALNVKGTNIIAKSELEDVKIGLTKEGEYLCLVNYEFSGLGIRPDVMVIQTKEVNGQYLIDSVSLPKAD